MDKKIVRCMDDSSWHGEYCIVDMTFRPEGEEPMAVLLSNRRVGHHITGLDQLQEESFTA